MPAFFARAILNWRHFSAGVKVFKTIINDRTSGAIVFDGLVCLLTRVLRVKAEDALKIAWNFRFANEHGRLLQSLSKPLTDSIIECILPSRRAKEVRASIRLTLENGISLGLGKIIFIVADGDHSAL